MNGKPARSMVQIRGLSKGYAEGGGAHRILSDVDLDIAEGEFFVLLGKSGSGKSTLLNLMSGIDQADHGSVVIDGTNITQLDERRLTLFRRDHIGIIFQFFNLIPTLTVLENITLPAELRGGNADARALDLLERVGLRDRAHSYPDRLSGGEKQRVAIARALAQDPAIIIADEPTGNLDEETGQQILRLLLELTRDVGRTLIMATHNPEIVPLADRVCRIHDSKLVITLRDSQPVKELFL
ncbi:MAG: ABC transporter ATP-binding protein [Chloroflexi bacterium]|nr:ABC transporter ATP-binding protein [Chloroflexota bacterium]